MPLLKRRSGRELRTISDDDLDACIDALSQLSLGRPPLQSRGSHKRSKSQSRTDTTSGPKLISQLSHSRPRFVSPMLDTSVAVSHKPPLKNIPSHSLLIDIPRTKNIDIPRSSRRKVCSIPYQRPAIRPSASPESPSSPSLSRSISRTPSLVSDHESDASSPSISPDFPSMPTFACKGSFLETPFERSPVCHSRWHDVDFGTDVYG